MRIIVIGSYNTNMDRIQYPCLDYIEKIRLEYPTITFHFIDPMYENSTDIELENLIFNSDCVFKYGISFEDFLNNNPIKPGDIIIDFSRSWSYATLKNYLNIEAELETNGYYILLPLSCGCNHKLYTLNIDGKKYIDYHLLIDPLIEDIDIYLQKHPPLLEPLFKLTSDIDILNFLADYNQKLQEYLLYTEIFNLNDTQPKIYLINEFENKNVIYGEISRWISTIRWFILENKELKTHLYPNINSDNYTIWYHYLTKFCQKIIPDYDINELDLLSIIQLYPDESFNFKLISQDINKFYECDNKKKYRADLNYHNTIQYEIYVLDNMRLLFRNKIKGISENDQQNLDNQVKQETQSEMKEEEDDDEEKEEEEEEEMDEEVEDEKLDN